MLVVAGADRRHCVAACALAVLAAIALAGPTGAGELAAATEFQRSLGGIIFRKTWVSAPASTDSSDGLGPLFNARSCNACHPRGMRGPGPRQEGAGDRGGGLVLRLSVPPLTVAEHQSLADGRVLALPEPTYGVQLQTDAIQGHAAEGRLRTETRLRQVKLSDGTTVVLRHPAYHIERLGYGPMRPDTMTSPRLAPPLLGLGLLDSIPAADVLALEDIDDRDGDGISGRASRVGPGSATERPIGRFGWKAGTASVRAQVAEAFATDMGLSSALRPQPSGDCTPRQAECVGAPDGRSDRHGGHEVGDVIVDLVASYVAGLLPPPTPDRVGPEHAVGRALFAGTGCAACHRPSFTIPEDPADSNSGPRTIQPYSDLLLHDMGERLADERPDGTASGREWRTTPLWGIVLSLDGDGNGALLHDGRARTIEEAVLWHDGEADKARDAFAALPRAERDRLILFVKSL